MAEPVSFAEREFRQRAADNRRRIALSADLVGQASAAVQDRLPEGWRAVARQPVAGALYSLEVEPAAVGIDVIAYLIPPTTVACSGWLVRVHHRTLRVCFPLYCDGGARAAEFAAVCDAFDAAVGALRVEIAAAPR
ncbi:hypothetical protein [Verrucosispora sp. ts21]|uniref:hypothetical protein n=1 Tax=Verrucosispora sp. ts21 TaxID=2069341 RepID=UPI0011AF74E5|nr:hypothetical protein [Verrucosispora sp. ts21]